MHTTSLWIYTWIFKECSLSSLLPLQVPFPGPKSRHEGLESHQSPWCLCKRAVPTSDRLQQGHQTFLLLLPPKTFSQLLVTVMFTPLPKTGSSSKDRSLLVAFSANLQPNGHLNSALPHLDVICPVSPPLLQPSAPIGRPTSTLASAPHFRPLCPWHFTVWANTATKGLSCWA